MSRISSSRLSATYAATLCSLVSPCCSLRPSAWAIVEASRSESRSGARSQKTTPSGKRSSAWAPPCKARRVLPVPPGPVSVTRRVSDPPRRPSSSSSSRSRPTSGLGAAGRFVSRDPSPRSGCCERVVLVEDLPVERLEIWGGVDSQLVDQRFARLSVVLERLGLPPRAVEGHHQLRAEALAQRMLSELAAQARL